MTLVIISITFNYQYRSMDMFDNEISYLYSDDYLTSLSSNEIDSSKKSINSWEYRPIRTRVNRERASTLPTSRRSKHIILFREDNLKRDKYQMSAKRLKEKRQLLEENLKKKIRQLEDEQLFLENDLRQRHSYIRELKTEINNSLSMNSNDEEKMSSTFDQYPHGFDIFNMSITRILDLNIDTDDNQ